MSSPAVKDLPTIANGLKGELEKDHQLKKTSVSSSDYTQYPIIRNGHIRNGAEFWGKFKKQALGRSNLRNASKNLRNPHS